MIVHLDPGGVVDRRYRDVKNTFDAAARYGGDPSDYEPGDYYPGDWRDGEGVMHRQPAAAPAPVVLEVSKRGLIAEARADGVWSTLRAVIQAQPEHDLDEWEAASRIRQDDVRVRGGMSLAGLSDPQIDDLFVRAAAYG